jgi:hypothetical protein
MGLKYLVAGGAAILLTIPMAEVAYAQQVPVAGPSQALVAQNTYYGGTGFSQDSFLQNGPDPYAAINAETVLHNEVLAAETNLNISGAFMHTQYHENFPPGSGDDENGYMAGFGVGASVLLPHLLVFPNVDLYSALNYDFSAGNLDYGGHYLSSGLPVQATDRAVFNRIEARLGLGFPLIGGAELIPFIAGGYQSWNRNIENKGQIGTDEFYDTALLGGGVKLDVPLTPALVASASVEMLALIAGNVSFNNVNVNHGLGGSAEERAGLGLDYAVQGPFHVFADADWEHFNYAGNKPTSSTYSPACGCELYEPLSTTTQFGVNLGVAYSF